MKCYFTARSLGLSWLLVLGAYGQSSPPPTRVPGATSQSTPRITDTRTSDDIGDPDYWYALPGTKAQKPETRPEKDVELLDAPGVRPLPRPYLYLGPTLMPDGYRSLAYNLEGGIDLESSRVIFQGSGAYDNGHKTNDADQPNPNGHDRYLSGAAYYRLPRLRSMPGWLADWFAGAGWRWSQLSTTNYTKGGNRPQFGGGFDVIARDCEICRRFFSMRATVDWFMAGDDWQNGGHGLDIGITVPTPREKRHWFYRARYEIYRFHETLTDPANLPLTRLQQNDRSGTSSESIGIVCRF